MRYTGMSSGLSVYGGSVIAEASMVRFAVVTGVIALLGACSKGDPVDSDTDRDTTVVVDSDDDTGTDYPRGTLSGHVTDPDGHPVVGAMVNFCHGQCASARTDDAGVYTLADVHAWIGSFYVKPDAANTDGLLPLMAPLTVTEGAMRTLDVTMFRAATTPALPSVAADVTVTSTLVLHVGADILEPPLFEPLPEVVSGVDVPLDKLLPIEGINGTVVAAFYVTPFESTAATGVPVRTTDAFGLAAGDSVDVYAASDSLQYTWLPCGSLTAGDFAPGLSAVLVRRAAPRPS